MRLKISKIITILVVILNVIALYYTWRLITRLRGSKTSIFHEQLNQGSHSTRSPNKHISKSITVVIRQFELYENDISATVESFLTIFPNIQILVICDDVPYPPLDIMLSNTTSKNVKVVNLSLSLNLPWKDRLPILMIKTKYVLFIPDSTRIPSRQVVATMLADIGKNPSNLVSVLSVSEKAYVCLNIDLKIREWSVKYESISGGTLCNAVIGKHATLIETHLLRRLPDPFMLPFPEALYLQTAAQHSKIHVILSTAFWDGRPVLHSHHAQWKKQQADNTRRKLAYSQLAIKKVVRETGVVEWYGCTRETNRCFGTVYDSIPSYLYKDRWTPPCCLNHLRKTARHVLSLLADAGIRHWLEAGSLLGAMRHGDILPWDHDVDIGFNRDDVKRLSWLARASSRPITDDQGFLWEKATEGQFFRIQFSKSNRIHVNLFPFFSKNGTMTRDGWFTNHMNMEFPDYFLHPMSSIEFIGKQVPSPNNIRDFLELKFGKGVIENPQYPNPARLKFPVNIGHG